MKYFISGLSIHGVRYPLYEQMFDAEKEGKIAWRKRIDISLRREAETKCETN